MKYLPSKSPLFTFLTWGLWSAPLWSYIMYRDYQYASVGAALAACLFCAFCWGMAAYFGVKYYLWRQDWAAFQARVNAEFREIMAGLHEEER